MTTVVQAFTPIAQIANSHDEVIITQSAQAFKQYADAKPADVLGLFNKRSAVGLVWAGYISAKSGLSYKEIKPYLAGISQFHADITIHENSVQMLAELIVTQSRVEEPTPVLDRQLSTIKNALLKIKEGTVTNDSEKVAVLRLEVMDLLSVLNSRVDELINA